MTRAIDLTGKKFNRLTVMERSFKKRKCNDVYWVCRCNCGNTKEIKGNSLRMGRIKSCGCLKKEVTHGMTFSKEYRVWSNMKNRCKNSKDPGFKNYGGRGIIVCDRWQRFENFYEDMGDKPKGKSLDRIDNDKGYDKENCRWATKEEQDNNKRNNRIIYVNGAKKTLSEWSKLSRISVNTIICRIQRGWDTYRAVFQPPIKGGSHDEIHNHRETNG